jgi:hypothetical protein
MFPALKTSDLITFIPMGNHIVPPLAAPVPMIGKSTHTLMGLPLCVAGDEIPSFLRVPLPYTAPPFATPGMGKLVVVPPPTHYSKTHTSGFRPNLLMGPPFTAQFIVNAPATMQAGPVTVPDPVVTKSFTVQYVSTTPTYIMV